MPAYVKTRSPQIIAVFSGVRSACSSKRSWTSFPQSNSTSVRFQRSNLLWSEAFSETAVVPSKGIVVVMGLGLCAANEIIFQEQTIDSGAEKSLNRFMRGVYDRLPFYVEARIQHNLAAANLPYRFQQGVERRVVMRRNGLHARRAIDMGDCGQRRAILFADVHRGDHIRQRRHRRNVEPSVDFFDRDSGRERPKAFPLFDHRVDPIAHFRIRRIGQDTAVAKRTRSVLHSSPIPGDDLSLVDHLCSPVTGLFDGSQPGNLDCAGECLERGVDFARTIARTEERYRESLVDDLAFQ